MSFGYEEQPFTMFKISILGIKGVGKSTFAKSLFPPGFKIFDANTYLTIGIDFYPYDYPLSSSKSDNFIRYSIWVLNPDSPFKSQLHYYLHGSSAILIIFDVSNPTSLDLFEYWMEIIKKNCGNSPTALLGNKADLKNHLKDAKALADSLVKKYQLMAYYEISALQSWNIKPIFNDLTNYFAQIFPSIKERMRDNKHEYTRKLKNNLLN
ncbi:MAG: hypothetical protein ACFE96_02840 [Candidatus Hermodarchaeota archaeon]